jgi:hypothetical protein
MRRILAFPIVALVALVAASVGNAGREQQTLTCAGLGTITVTVTTTTNDHSVAWGVGTVSSRLHGIPVSFSGTITDLTTSKVLDSFFQARARERDAQSADHHLHRAAGDGDRRGARHSGDQPERRDRVRLVGSGSSSSRRPAVQAAGELRLPAAITRDTDHAAPDPCFRRPALSRRSRRVENLASLDYSKKLRPASPPTVSIHQASPTSRNSTVSPFENLAAASRPLITTSTTIASANDLRNCHEAGVQCSIGRPPTRSQPIRSQPGCVM